jgi:hypothetical protein
MGTEKIPEVSPGAACNLNAELSKLLDYWSPRSVLVQLAVEVLKRSGARGDVGYVAELILGQWPHGDSVGFGVDDERKT